MQSANNQLIAFLLFIYIELAVSNLKPTTTQNHKTPVNQTTTPSPQSFY